MPLTWAAAAAVVVAVVIGIALLLGDRRETFQAQAYRRDPHGCRHRRQAGGRSCCPRPVRWAGDGGQRGRATISSPVSENRQLRQQVAELEQWRDQAIALQNENARLRALLGLKTDPPIPMVTAHVITDARGPFANTRLVDVGAEKGVKVGNPVMSERGLVGRVVGAAQGASRVLLVTDVSSRIPVMDDRTNARAILSGDGGPNPKLAYLRGGQDPVKVGDRILTSGDGGVFPRGLPVGLVIKGLDGNWRVQLDSDDAPIDYVRILQFRDFSQLADPKGAERQPAAAAGAGDAAQVAGRQAAGALRPSRRPPPPAPAPRPPPKPGAADQATTPRQAGRRGRQEESQGRPEHKTAEAKPARPPRVRRANRRRAADARERDAMSLRGRSPTARSWPGWSGRWRSA